MEQLNKFGKARRGLYSITVLTALLFSFAFIAVACPSSDDNGDDNVVTPPVVPLIPDPDPDPEPEPEPDPADDALKIGYLADFSGGLAEYGAAIQNGVQLAVEQINAAGGVNGQPIEFVIGDTALDSGMATIEARRLIEVEGVHAIVGPLSSGVALAVAEGVVADAQIPLISPSATSPGITDADDNGYLFRTALSDAAQGVVLADNLVEANGVDNVGVVYINNAYGAGLAGVFEDNFDGTVTPVSYEEDAASYLGELRSAAANGAESLVIIGYAETQIILRESLENELYENYYFVDGNRSEELGDVVGVQNLEGRRGTAPGAGPATFSANAWNEAYMARFGSLPNLPFVREAYDAVVVIALAAEAADSVAGPDIRDQLQAVASPGGTVVIASQDSIAAGLSAVDQGNDVDYEGAASSVNWNEVGDIASGYVAIWEFQDGSPVTQETIPFALSGSSDVVVDPLKIGYLADFSGGLAEYGAAIQNGVQLAVEQINATGGVNGQPVEFVTGDTALDSGMATVEARRLIDVEGVSAIVGPLSSGVALAVGEGVAAEAQIPLISPSATSPGITDADDNGYLFRTALSDAAQGVVLADNLVEANGVDNVGVVYINNAYGAGLAGVFEDNFDGTVTPVSYEEDAASYLGELRSAAANGAESLVIIGYAETQIILRESLENELYENYYFVDGNRSEELGDVVGVQNLEGRRGTAPGAGPATDSANAWNEAYMARFGSLPNLPFVREAYDAVVAIALAAEAANSVEGSAIRDRLQGVASPGGLTVIASEASIGEGLRAADQGVDVDYEGAASSVNWNEVGDIASGYVDIWEFQDGSPVTQETIPFSLN